MKKSKVDISKFTKGIEITETHSSFTAPSIGWCKITSRVRTVDIKLT